MSAIQRHMGKIGERAAAGLVRDLTGSDARRRVRQHLGDTAKPDGRATRTLTALQERFVLEYLKDFNATRAYMRARPGASRSTADACARRMLGNARISKAIGAERERLARLTELTAEKVARENSRIAFFDPRKLFDQDGHPLPPTAWDADTAAAVAGFEVLERFEGSGGERRVIGRVLRYRFADKNSALERAAKLLGMFDRDNRQRSDPLRALLDAMQRSAVPVVASPPQEEEVLNRPGF